MVAKTKIDNSRTKQIVLLIGSVLVLALIVAVIYPLLKEKRATGKVIFKMEQSLPRYFQSL